MKLGICPYCKKLKWIGSHSLAGDHKPPFRDCCKRCHNKIHKQLRKRKKTYKRRTKKYQSGTPKGKRK